MIERLAENIQKLKSARELLWADVESLYEGGLATNVLEDSALAKIEEVIKDLTDLHARLDVEGGG